MMKTATQLLSLVAIAAALTACSKPEETKPEPQTSAKDAASSLAEDAKKVGDEAAKMAKEAGQAVSETAKDVAAAVDSAYKDGVAKVQTLLKDGKYEDALNSLKALGDLKLTPEQQQSLADIKQQIEAAWNASKAAGSNASAAVKGLLK